MSHDLFTSGSPDLNTQLRIERGWPDVQKGLTRILLGYAVAIFGTGLALLVVFGAASSLIGKGAPRVVSPGTLWAFYLGLGLIAVIGMFSYGMIVAGQWLCLLNASERHGARWMMFGCITCMVIGPAFNFVAGFSGVKNTAELKRGPNGFNRIEITTTGRVLQLVGVVAGLLHSICFVLFLRAVALCFASQRHVWLVNYYVMFSGGLMAASLYVALGPPERLFRPVYLLSFGAGALVTFLWYVYIILSIRCLIGAGIHSVQSPLDRPPTQPSLRRRAHNQGGFA